MGAEILPGTGRWRPQADGGAAKQGGAWGCPSTIRVKNANGPPPRAGEDFSSSAQQLAGFAGAFLGWAPDAFWRATPAELGAVVRALGGGEAVAPPDAGMLARLREAYPDG